VKVWVIDTSSIIDLRKIPHAERQAALDAMDKLVDTGQLFFPPEVLAELQRHDEKSDVAYTWAKKNAANATKYGHLYEAAKAVLGTVPNLIDPDKVSTVDQADPYVIATAQRLIEEGKTPTIITEDAKTTPKKTSLAHGAGILELPVVSLRVFLQVQGIVIST
jgi:hypothetical protein